MVLRKHHPFKNSINKSTFNLLLVATFLFSGAQLAVAGSSKDNSWISSCDIDLTGECAVYRNRMQLSEMSPGFVKEHPSLLMNSAQYLLSMIKLTGIEEKESFSGYSKHYKLFSEASVVNSKKRIIGHNTEIDKFVTAIENQANEDRSGSLVPLLVGPPGTGKTEFSKIVKAAYKYYSDNVSELYFYTFAWDRQALMNDLPSLKTRLETSFTEDWVLSPLNSSPIALFPPPVQKFYFDEAQEKLVELTNINVTQPNYVLDPISKKILDTLLENNFGEVEKVSFSDYMGVLDKYIKIVKLQIGDQSTTCPIIDKQPTQFDSEKIFLASNPMGQIFGGNNRDPFAFSYNTMLLGGNRNLVFFDEFLRNPNDFIQLTLGLFESRELNTGMGPSVPLDMVIFAATNTSSLEVVAKDNDNSAALDRLSRIYFNWSIFPHEIAETLIYMRGLKNLQMSDLSQKDAEWEEIDTKKLFPNSNFSKGKLKGIDGRYTLKDVKRDVIIAPRTLMFLANFISMTRISNNSELLTNKKVSNSIATQSVFTDKLQRLRAMRGEITLHKGERRELNQISTILKEGTFGMGARKSGELLTDALKVAQDRNENTLTPLVIREVFNDMMDHDKFDLDDDEKIKWYADFKTLIMRDLYPLLQQDIYESFLDHGLGKEIYSQILIEISEMVDANNFDLSEGKDGTPINRERYKKIVKIFEMNTQRKFDPESIVALFKKSALGALAMNSSSKDSKTVPTIQYDDDLLQAINYYLVDGQKSLNVRSLADFMETRRSTNPNANDTYERVTNNLYKLGYNKKSAEDAIKLVAQAEEMSKRSRQ